MINLLLFLGSGIAVRDRPRVRAGSGLARGGDPGADLRRRHLWPVLSEASRRTGREEADRRTITERAPHGSLASFTAGATPPL